MVQRLYRSRTDRMLGGVSGGLGHYFGLDPVIVRLLFVVLALTTNGFGLVLYLILWMSMPQAPDPQGLPPGARFDPQTGQPLQTEATPPNQTVRLPTEGAPAVPPAGRSKVLATVLVGVGALILVDNLGNVFGFDLAGVAVPLLLVALGVYLLRGTRV